MQIKIISVGKLKEKYWREACAEYLKRLRPYAKLEVIEVDEERTADNPSSVEIQLGMAKEGERINKKLSPQDYIIPLAVEGKMLASEELANLLGKLALEGKSQVSFIIGGSHGMDQDVIKRGDFLLSFSPLTFPHQMMRVLLLEQIYRGFKILKGEPYHK